MGLVPLFTVIITLAKIQTSEHQHAIKSALCFKVKTGLNEGKHYLGLFYSRSGRNAKYGCRTGRSDGQRVIGRVFSYTLAVF